MERRVKSVGCLPSAVDAAAVVAAVLTLDGDVFVALEEALEDVGAAGEDEGHSVCREVAELTAQG